MKSGHKCIVFDTSTLIGCCLTQQGRPAEALAYATRHYTLAVSSATKAEALDVFRRDKFDAWKSPQDRMIFLNGFLGAAKEFIVAERVNDCRDPKDNKFLELALAAKAIMIVSSDSDLLVLNPYRNVEILTPADFLVRMKSQNAG
jgi:uncharacterized protein